MLTTDFQVSHSESDQHVWLPLKIGHWKTGGPVLHLSLSILEMFLLRDSEWLGFIAVHVIVIPKMMESNLQTLEIKSKSSHFLVVFIKGNVKMILETKRKIDAKFHYFLLQELIGTYRHEWKKASLKIFLKSKEGANTCMRQREWEETHSFAKHW